MATSCLAASIGTKRYRGELMLLVSLTIMVVLSQVLIVASMYIPNGDMMMGNSNLMRRADSDDDDEMDTRASAPYQDQGENSAPAADDGFGDNEQEGSYDETPKDEEGQADLERFFDDHLGASERDGMDKENLPTNLVPFVVGAPGAQLHRFGLSDHGFNSPAVTQQLVAASQPAFAYDRLASQPTISYLEQNPMIMSPNNVETSYIRLPNKRLIITRQITRGPIYKGGLDDNFPPIPAHILQLQGRDFKQNQDKDAQSQQQQSQQQASSNNNEELNAKGSDIVRTEDDDMDPVYVTTATNKPFKIDALGGFDPEEDFQDASRDLEEPPKPVSNPGQRRRSSDEDYQQTQDISFNDPEPDTLFNDASETDEVIFDSDPYQTDLEAEMSGQSATEKPDNEADASAATAADETEDSPANERAPPKPVSDDDDSESNWVNDGVEDMDVPSQSYQDAVLEKAARNEAARRAAEEPSEDEARQQDQEPQQEQPQQPEADQGEGENQRMPNADYLKNDLSGIDDADDALR